MQLIIYVKWPPMFNVYYATSYTEVLAIIWFSSFTDADVAEISQKSLTTVHIFFKSTSPSANKLKH